MKLGEAMYKAQQAPGEPHAKKDDDVIDADFKDVERRQEEELIGARRWRGP
jgi:hypothetical protein